MLKPRIQLENRESLKDSIPLDTPYVVFIDPSSRCNFACGYCPNRIMKNKSIMDFGLYKKIIDQISEFPKKIKVLRLYMMGEPLLNPRFFDMVAHAKSKGVAEKIDTTTNASLIKHIFNYPAIDCGLDRINISVAGMNAAQYKEHAGHSIDFDKFVDDITNLYKNKKQCEIIIKINGDILSEEEKQKFEATFSPISDGIYFEHTSECWPGFEVAGVNKDVGIYGQELTDLKVCPYVFYQMTIQSDGKVSLCFLDWDRQLIIGDVKDTSVKAIWDSQLLKWFQIQMLRGHRDKIKMCKQCNQLRYGMPVNLDDSAEELLNRIV